MDPRGIETELTCAACGAVQRCGPAQIMQRLAEMGMMKRSADPDPDLDLLLELLRGVADRLPCHECATLGLGLREPENDDDAWEVVRHCDGCGKPIAPERLEVFPGITRCATCQIASENGDDQEREFCDDCGSVMSLRVRRSAGPAAYEMTCPNCRR